MLDNEMTLVEEVREYLTYVLQLGSETVEQTVLELQAHLARIETDD
jgi:hypothetical protein